MSFETARQTLVSHIISVKPSNYVVVFDNDPFDWSNAPELFHHIEITFEGASQIGMSFNPQTRDYGFVRMRTHVREGRGSRGPALALDWLKSQVAFKILQAPGIRITLEQLNPDHDPARVRGWCLHDSSILFRIHPTTTVPLGTWIDSTVWNDTEIWSET